MCAIVDRKLFLKDDRIAHKCAEGLSFIDVITEFFCDNPVRGNENFLFCFLYSIRQRLMPFVVWTKRDNHMCSRFPETQQNYTIVWLSCCHIHYKDHYKKTLIIPLKEAWKRDCVKYVNFSNKFL